MTDGAHLVAALVDAHNRRDDDALRRCYARDAVVHPDGWPEPVPVADWVAGLALIRESFPDLRFDVRRVASGQDVALVELTMSGSNDGPFHLGDGDRTVLRTSAQSLPPTGRRMSLDGVVVLDTADGSVTAERHYWQQWPVYAQLGLLIAEPAGS